jgi:hypothetical protein
MTFLRNHMLVAAALLLTASCTSGDEGADEEPNQSSAPAPAPAPVVRIDAGDLSCDSFGGFDSISLAWTAPDGIPSVLSRDGEILVESTGSGGFEDLGGTVSETHSYSLSVNNGEFDIDCGEARLVEEVGQPTCSVSLDTFALITWDLSEGRAEIYRNAERVIPDRGTLSSPFIDTAAPVDLPLTYEVVAVDSSGRERASKTAFCGVVTVPALPAQESELQIAQEAARAYRAPYGYATIVPICPDCETQKVDVYFAFNNESRVPLKSWIGDSESSVTDDVWFTDPLAVPTLLLEALANGDLVTSVTDEATGLIVQWTINGEGAILECLESDLAPLELREKDCGGSVYTD